MFKKIRVVDGLPFLGFKGKYSKQANVNDYASTEDEQVKDIGFHNVFEKSVDLINNHFLTSISQGILLTNSPKLNGGTLNKIDHVLINKRGHDSFKITVKVLKSST